MVSSISSEILKGLFLFFYIKRHVERQKNYSTQSLSKPLGKANRQISRLNLKILKSFFKGI